MNELPFELKKYHKSFTRCNWARQGLNLYNFEEIYNKYIYATHCQLCNKQFATQRERYMEHCHKTGEFRNIVCNSCNQKKTDVKLQSNNTSGYKGISKVKDKKMKQGFRWVFAVNFNGNQKIIKSGKDLDKLVKFAEQWKKDNNYYT